MNNKQRGTAFEEELAHRLYDDGFWVHLLRQSDAGQPADIIAVKGHFCYLIDCKTVGPSGFALSRIEPNQESAMKLFQQRSDFVGLFALRLDDGSVYMMSGDALMHMRKTSSKMSVKNIQFHEKNKYENWLRFVNAYCNQ